MLKFFKAIPAFLRDEEGQDIIEYGLLAAFIAIVVAAILMSFDDKLTTIYNKILNALTNAANAA